MRKKNNHSSSEVPQLYRDFQIYRSLKTLQKTTNPYSVSRMSTTKKPRMSSFFSPSEITPIKEKPPTQQKVKREKKIKSMSEAKSEQIANMIKTQIKDDVKHYSDIGENALFGFQEKVSLYNNFFTRYLFDNYKEISKMDLVVQPFSLFSNVEEKNETREPDVSPQEKIRRQRHRGSIFAGSSKDSPKMSPISPSSRTKAYNFKEKLFRGKFKERSPQEFARVYKGESKKELPMLDLMKNNQEKKDQLKNSWEYLYYLGQSDLQESQKKLETLKQTLTPIGESVDEERRIFLQMVKKNQLNHVQTMLDKHKKEEKNGENLKKIVNTIDVYLNQNALHWAAKRNMKEMAEILMQNGIDVMRKDMANRTPRDLAKKNGFFELARRIEDFEYQHKRSLTVEKIDLNFNL